MWKRCFFGDKIYREKLFALHIVKGYIDKKQLIILCLVSSIFLFNFLNELSF